MAAYFAGRSAPSTAADARSEWRELNDTLGLASALIGLGAGGLGGGMGDAIVIMEELGRANAQTPFVETVLVAGSLLSASTSREANDALAGIASGEMVIAIAHEEQNQPFSPTQAQATAERTTHGYLLSGRKVRMHASPAADKLSVSARLSGKSSSLGLFLIDAGDALIIRDITLLNGSSARDMELRSAPTPATSLLYTDATSALAKAYNRGIVGICAEGVGCMRSMLDQTVEHVRTRRQFKRALAELQVVRHGLADMLVAIEKAMAITHRAALAIDGGEDCTRFAAAAKVVTSRALRFVGQNAIQFHGAIGTTEELPLNRYFKRATMIASQFGNVDDHIMSFARASDS